jgi:hypothetical protein
MKIGTEVLKLAYSAIMGAYKNILRDDPQHSQIEIERRTMIPKILFAVATIAFPVPRSFVGNNSGVSAYRTPYITLLTKLYAQFHPRRALDVRAVVEARMNTPVRAMKQ